MTVPHRLSATAFVVTPRPERYIKQLVSHFGNKVRTELTEDGGRLQFDFGVCDLKAVPTGIELIGTAEDEAQLETLKDVVGRHLVRFGANDELTVSWAPWLMRASGRPESTDMHWDIDLEVRRGDRSCGVDCVPVLCGMAL